MNSAERGLAGPGRRESANASPLRLPAPLFRTLFPHQLRALPSAVILRERSERRTSRRLTVHPRQLPPNPDTLLERRHSEGAQRPKNLAQ